MADEKKKTGYESPWEDQLKETANKILNREKFSYDVNGDALYKQYKDRYTQQGRQAMMDTMGQAQAMTGGYGNSYAQSVGQQTYQGYMQGLTDKIPTLYQIAMDKYTSEGNQMRDNMNLMMQQDEIGYGRYRDQMADQEAEYQKQEDAYNKLVALMTNYHYEPTAEEMAAAGMPEAHKNAIMKPYYDMLAEQAAAANRYSGYNGEYVEPQVPPVEPENTEPTLSDAGKQFMGNLPYLNAGGSVETWKRTVDQRLEKAHANGQVSDEDVILITKQLGL